MEDNLKKILTIMKVILKHNLIIIEQILLIQVQKDNKINLLINMKKGIGMLNHSKNIN